MKKRLFACFILLLSPLSIVAEEATQTRFPEGDYYQVLPLEATAKPVVTEFFSFFCGHCYKFEPLMGELMNQLKPGVGFEKSHVDFMPRGRKDIADMYTKALYAAQILKVEEKVIPKIFESIHVKRQTLDTEAKMAELFTDLGIPGDKFKAAFNGFMANGAVGQMKSAQEQVQLQSVPTVVVNGKYKVVPNKITSGEEYIALINYLTTLK